jgi:hypothetical protein
MGEREKGRERGRREEGGGGRRGGKRYQLQSVQLDLTSSK